MNTSPNMVLPKTVVRNLIYHITPMGNYQWNLEQIQQRIKIFNGKKIAFVSQGPGLDSLDKVAKLIPEMTLIAKANNNIIRETSTFVELLGQVESIKENEITFYAHTKGVTRFADKAVKMWTEALYHYNLDYLSEVESRIFTWYPTVGALKRYGTFGHFPKESRWHYSGTFFWLRNKSIFNKKWQFIHKTRYGTEAYPSIFYTSTEAGCIFGDDIGNLYDIKYIKRLLAHRL